MDLLPPVGVFWVFPSSPSHDVKVNPRGPFTHQNLKFQRVAKSSFLRGFFRAFPLFFPQKFSLPPANPPNPNLAHFFSPWCFVSPPPTHPRQLCPGMPVAFFIKGRYGPSLDHEVWGDDPKPKKNPSKNATPPKAPKPFLKMGIFLPF